ncbi:hypothetical protein REPUB_Repub02eG0020400 [Reevesia pubescens]
MHKRASLPKCALEQLKGSILEKIHVPDGNENVPDDENGNQEVNLSPQIDENENEVLQDGLLERNLTPSRRCRNDLLAEDLVGVDSVSQDSRHNDLNLNAKKFKQDATCTTQSVGQIPIHLHAEERLEDESGMIAEVTEIEGKGKDSQAGEDDQDVRVASRTLGQSNAVGHVELQVNEMENVQNADADVMDLLKYRDRPSQTVVMDESYYVENGSLQKDPSGDAGENIDQGFPSSSPNSIYADVLPQNIDHREDKTDVENGAPKKVASGATGENMDQGSPLSSPNSSSANVLQQNIHPVGAKADIEHPCAEQVCEFEDERFNIPLKKSLFLSSKGTPSRDPADKADFTEKLFCVKCNQNGQVLVCRSSGCTLVVHERCLGSAARFDDKGNFYCPFCAYSASVSKYLEAKSKASLARKELPAFMELCSKILTEEQRKLQRHQGEREHKFVSPNQEANQGPSVSRLNGNKVCVEEETLMGVAVHVQCENNEQEEKVVRGHQSMREHVHIQEELPANLKSSENTETVPANQVEVEGVIVKEAREPQITDPPQKLVCSFNRELDGEGQEKILE